MTVVSSSVSDGGRRDWRTISMSASVTATMTGRGRGVVSGGRVYVGSSDGKLYVVDVNSGKTVFEFEAGAPITASPAVARGRLVIGATDGTLFCLG